MEFENVKKTHMPYGWEKKLYIGGSKIIHKIFLIEWKNCDKNDSPLCTLCTFCVQSHILFSTIIF